jgi:hypothetical protein
MDFFILDPEAALPPCSLISLANRQPATWREELAVGSPQIGGK